MRRLLFPLHAGIGAKRNPAQHSERRIIAKFAVRYTHSVIHAQAGTEFVIPLQAGTELVIPAQAGIHVSAKLLATLEDGSPPSRG